MVLNPFQGVVGTGFFREVDNWLGGGGGQGINQYGQELENNEGRKPTFRASIGAFTPQATPQDFFTLTGSASCVTKLVAVEVWLAATAAAAYELYLNFNSAPDTGGTSTNPTGVSSDPGVVLGASLAAQASNYWTTPYATVNAYTVAPTAGTKLGTIRSGRVAGGTLTGGGSGIAPILWVFGQYNDQCPTLRTASQQIALNGNGAALPSGAVFEVNVIWTEEPLTGN